MWNYNYEFRKLNPIRECLEATKKSQFLDISTLIEFTLKMYIYMCRYALFCVFYFLLCVMLLILFYCLLQYVVLLWVLSAVCVCVCAYIVCCHG